MIDRFFMVALALGLGAGSGRAAGPIEEPPETGVEVRGMTVSCTGAGLSWGSEKMVATLELLKGLGVNWVAIHPYGGITNHGTVGHSRIDRLYQDPRWLRRAIGEAHRLGLKIMIKPHLAYWGSKFSWRGEIEFQTPEEWERFFATYEEWISKVARLSADCDAFVVGTELDRTLQYTERWRKIIHTVRAQLDAPLTYAASWNEYQNVPFWNELDVVGIQGYFPLVAHEGIPTTEELERAWGELVRELEGFGEKTGRKVLLAELGYNQSLEAAVRPWSYRRDAGPEAADLQLRCLSAALSALENSVGIVGAFLWKWFPGEISRGNFVLSNSGPRAVIASQWSRAP